MTTQSLAVKLISFVITFYLEVLLLRSTLLVRRLFYSGRDEEEGGPQPQEQVFIFPASPLGTYPWGASGVPPFPVAASHPQSSGQRNALERDLGSGRGFLGYKLMALASSSRSSLMALSSPPVPQSWVLASPIQ